MFGMETNPVLVKEIRQSVRSRFLPATAMLAMFVFLVVSLTSVGSAGIAEAAGSVGRRTGRNLFITLFFLLNTGCLFFVPIYHGFRLGSERSSGNMDLLYVSTLRPAAIVFGKFLSGLAAVMILFSVAGPFMAFTYLLRGLDLPTIFMALAGSFLFNTVALQFGLLLGALPGTTVFKVLVGLFGVAVLLFMMPTSMVFGLGLIEGRWLRGWDFWAVGAAFAGGAALAVAVLMSLSVSLLMPAAANRAAPARATCTAAWLCLLAVALGVILAGNNSSFILVWAVPSLAVCAIAMPLCASCPDHLSRRTQRQVPRNPLARLLAYPFFNLSTAGLVWACLLAVLTVAGVFLVRPSDPDVYDITISLAVIVAYSLGYSLLAMQIGRRLIPDRMPIERTWILFVFLVAIGSWGPMLVGIVTRLVSFGARSGAWLDPWLIGCPFGVLTCDKGCGIFLPASLIFAGIMVVLSVGWFVSQAREYAAAGREPSLEWAGH